MTFRVGQKVVRVSGTEVVEFRSPNVDEVVTISNIEDKDTKHSGIRTFLLFQEYQHRINGQVYWCFAHHFRPVVEKKTDISALTALLNPANHKLLEGV